MHEDYILFGDIRKQAQKLLSLSPQQPLTFPDIYRYLQIHHKGIPKPPLPDFMDWDFTNDQTFLNLIDLIPVTDKTFVPVVELHGSQKALVYVPPLRPVFIARDIGGLHTTPHIDDCFVLLYVFHGNCTLTLNNFTRTMHTGELCIISPRIPRFHTLTADDVVLSITVEKETFKQAFSKLLPANNCLSSFFRNTLLQDEHGYMFFMLPLCNDLRQVFQHFFQETVHWDEYSSNVFLSYLDVLFTQIIRSHKDSYDYYAHLNVAPAPTTLPHILHYIQTHYMENLSLENLSQKFHYEKTYLSKLIHQFTGTTYTDIIYECRLEKAKELLRFTDYKITDIANMVGYNSSDHFSRSFKNYTGMSPRKYRNEHKDH